MCILKIKMKLALLIILVIAVTMSCQSQPEKKHRVIAARIPARKHFPNTLVNKKFQTGELIGLTSDTVDYPLIPVDSGERWSGNVIKFKDSVHFVSAYEAWCGNDCFVAVYGRYYFIDSLKIRFYTDTITYSGECKRPNVYTTSNPPLDLFLVKGPQSQLLLNHGPAVE